MLFQAVASICFTLPLSALLFGLCALSVLEISFFPFCPLPCLAFSLFFHLSGQLFQKCDRTLGIILEQFNNMSDVTIFRGGQLMHIPCNSSGGKVLSF